MFVYITGTFTGVELCAATGPPEVVLLDTGALLAISFVTVAVEAVGMGTDLMLMVLLPLQVKVCTLVKFVLELSKSMGSAVVVGIVAVAIFWGFTSEITTLGVVTACDNVVVVCGNALPVIAPDIVVTMGVALDILEEGWTGSSCFASMTLSAFAAMIHFVVGFNSACLEESPLVSDKLLVLLLSGEYSLLEDKGLILSTMTFSGSEISSPRSN